MIIQRGHPRQYVVIRGNCLEIIDHCSCVRILVERFVVLASESYHEEKNGGYNVVVFIVYHNRQVVQITSCFCVPLICDCSQTTLILNAAICTLGALVLLI